ncbi:MAG: hypothetical protein WC564_00165 [Patescibacteria group bacterium]
MKNKHPRTITGYNRSLRQLAKEIGNMTYDQVALFIKELSQDLERQSQADLGRGRKKLAKDLHDAAQQLAEAHLKMVSAWEICKPYMPENKNSSE